MASFLQAVLEAILVPMSNSFLQKEGAMDTIKTLEADWPVGDLVSVQHSFLQSVRFEGSIVNHTVEGKVQVFVPRLDRLMNVEPTNLESL